MSYYLHFLQFIQTNRHEFLNNMVWFHEEGNIANFSFFVEISSTAI